MVNWPVNFYITGNRIMMKILRFLHQSALISKEIHCLLSLHDDFDYNSSDFSRIIENNSGVGEVKGHRFSII